MNSKVIIEMEENQTWITNPDNDEKSKPFAFDYSYWSHDGSVTDADGVTLPDGPNSKYASQRMVFDDLGQDVLQNAWKGYNCSLFAYGQTGSGKSYSMVRYVFVCMSPHLHGRFNSCLLPRVSCSRGATTGRLWRQQGHHSHHVRDAVFARRRNSKERLEQGVSRHSEHVGNLQVRLF